MEEVEHVSGGDRKFRGDFTGEEGCGEGRRRRRKAGHPFLDQRREAKVDRVAIIHKTGEGADALLRDRKQQNRPGSVGVQSEYREE